MEIDRQLGHGLSLRLSPRVIKEHGLLLSRPRGWMLQGIGGAPVFPVLTYPSDFHMISTMKTMFQGGLNGQVSVPPEKRFLIHPTVRFVVTSWGSLEWKSVVTRFRFRNAARLQNAPDPTEVV